MHRSRNSGLLFALLALAVAAFFLHFLRRPNQSPKTNSANGSTRITTVPRTLSLISRDWTTTTSRATVIRKRS